MEAGGGAEAEGGALGPLQVAAHLEESVMVGMATTNSRDYNITDGELQLPGSHSDTTCHYYNSTMILPVCNMGGTCSLQVLLWLNTASSLIGSSLSVKDIVIISSKSNPDL